MKGQRMAWALLCLGVLAGGVARASDKLYVGLQDNNFHGVATFTPTLGLLNQVSIGQVVDGIAAGPAGTFYAGSGRTVTHYNDAGSEINHISASTTTRLHDLAFSGARLYASLTDNAFKGVAQFNENLGLLGQVPVDGSAGGVSFGQDGFFFVAEGNTIRKYADDGSFIGSISASATTVLKDLAFDGTTLLASLSDGSFHAVARFNANLGLLNQLNLGDSIDALAIGRDGEFYTATTNTVFHRGSDGSILSSISASGTTRIRDMSYFADPVPEPATMAALGLGMVALIRRRRQKSS